MKSFVLENKKILIVTFVLFTGITLFLFRPLLSGKELYQGDVERHRGMSKEIMDFREKYGKDPLWTNSMFSGMPAYQISTIHFGNLLGWLDKYLFKAFLPHPSGYVFLYFLGFFVLMLCLDVPILLALWASLAYGLGSYFIIIIEAGHNSKANALGYLPAMIGTFILLFRKQTLTHFSLFAFFTAMELNANHVQITYYGYMMMATLGFYFLMDAIKTKKVKSFLTSSALALTATILGILPNAGNLWCTYEYGKWSTRGKSELTINDGGKKDENKTSGLDKNYATQWSYGTDEILTFLIPDYKGGSSKPISRTYPQALKKVNPEFREQIGMMTSYFGPQPFTSGPVYLGTLVVILGLWGMIVSRNSLKYPLIFITVLAILLSWGKHFPLLTDFFFDYVPAYNKFRAVSMILIIPQLTFPLFAVLGLKEMMEQDFWKKSISLLRKHIPLPRFFMIYSFLILFFILSVSLVPSLWQNYTSPDEESTLVRELAQEGYPEEQIKMVVSRLMPEMEKARAEIVKSDTRRTLFFAFVCLLFVWLWMKGKMSTSWILGGLISLSTIDLLTVSTRYLNKESFVPAGEMQNRLALQTDADRRILSDSSLHKRVLNLSVSTFNDASTSYYHQSVGGYHGAKCKKYQEIIDFHLGKEIESIFAGIGDAVNSDSARKNLFEPLQVLNMLNTKYVLLRSRKSPEPILMENPAAFGPAWYVEEIRPVPNADSEIVALKKVNLKNTAILRNTYASKLKNKKFHCSSSRIVLTKYISNEAVYEANASSDAFVVFSEIYYPFGWQAYIDEKPAEHYPVNYILRGMEIPKGRHTIRFVFDPPSYKISNQIALAGSLMLFATLGIGTWLWFRKSNSEK